MAFRPIRVIRDYFTKNGWRGSLINGLSSLADVANVVGIGAEICMRWISMANPLVKSVFLNLAYVGDPLIYLVRGLVRIVYLVGRKKYPDVRFDEQKYGTHPHQNTLDIVATVIFSMAVILFFISPAVFPLHLAVAWTLGLLGTVGTIYLDHYYPMKKAKELYYGPQLRTLEEDEEMFKYLSQKHYSTWLYSALIFSMVLLLVVGSITTSGVALPATAALILDCIAKVGSVPLIVINTARLFNGASSDFSTKFFPFGPKRKVRPKSAEEPDRRSSMARDMQPVLLSKPAKLEEFVPLEMPVVTPFPLFGTVPPAPQQQPSRSLFSGRLSQ